MYSVYLGEVEKIEEWLLLGNFTEQEHNDLFRIINEEKISKKWLSELESYEETVNFNWEEIQKLQEEVSKCLLNNKLKENRILNCVNKLNSYNFKKGNLQLIFSGGD